MRRKVLLFAIPLVLTLCSCDVKQKQENSATSVEVSPTETVNAQKSPSPITENPEISSTTIPKPTQSPTLVPIPERDSDSIRIALRATMRLTEEESAEINRILKEEGLSCDVEFIPDTYWYNDHDWERWVDENEERLDIIHVGVWSNNIHMCEFMKKHLLPLNDYIETEDGRILRDAFGKTRWEYSETQEGFIYAIPVLNEKSDKKVYAAVNDDYLSLFGTTALDYEYVKKICDGIDYPGCKISIDSVSDKVLLSLCGYSWTYGGIPYDKNANKVTNTSECTEQLHNVCLQLYQDLKNGITVDESCNPDGVVNPIVYIYYDAKKEIEGYTSFAISENRYVVGTTGMYGVLASCPRKELALQVLTLCFSNPKIASILCWKNYGEKWEDSWDEKAVKWEGRVKETQSEPSDEKKRLFVAFSEEELNSLEKYSGDLYTVSKGYYVEQNGLPVLNPDFEKDLEGRDLWKPQNQKVYTIGVDALNRELEAGNIE